MNRPISRMRHIALLLLSVVIALLLILSACTPTPTPTPTPIPPPISNTEYGIANINPAGGFSSTANNANIANARSLEAKWDRWGVEWYWVEQPYDHTIPTPSLNPGTFIWSGRYVYDNDGQVNPLPAGGYDLDNPFDVASAAQAVPGMASHADSPIKTLVVLHGIPRRYDCAHLDQSVPADHDRYEYNTECDINQSPHPRVEGLFDTPAFGGTNYWGNFVHAVTTYLADRDVTYFETYNEPDNDWRQGNGIPDPNTGNGFMDDYVQMVRTTLDSADPRSKIILGAPMSPGNRDAEIWAAAAWGEVSAQSDIVDDLYAVAIHSYEWPFRTWTLTEQVRSYFPDKPVWVTESSLHKFSEDDSGYDQRQASYVFQEAAYARVAGVAVDIHYRMQDDSEGGIFQFGLYNTAGVPNPAANVFPLLNEYLSGAQLVSDPALQIMPSGPSADFGQFVDNNPYTRMVFYDTENARRVTLVWANQESESPIPATLPMWEESNPDCANLYDQEGQPVQLNPSGQSYSLSLEPANKEHNAGDLGRPLVGGSGYLLVERRCAASYQPSIDVVVVMDTTGSMGSGIAAAKSVAINYIDQLADSGVDYRAAVVDYKDKRYDPYASRLDLAFTKDRTAISNAINALSATGGGDTPEDVYSGLMTAINLPWRDGSKKVIILMGDAGPLDPEPGTGYTLRSVINAANAVDPASIYAIRIGNNTSMRSAFQQLANGTGGMTFDASNTTSSVSTAILNALNSVAHAPSAVIGENNGQIVGSIGTPIHFDASHSFDVDGFIVQYDWDFNNDGLFDLNSPDPTADYTYTQAYNGWVTLRVHDNDGNTNKVSAKIMVDATGNDTTPPVINITSPLPQAYLHTDSVNVSWTATDTGSGIASSTGALDSTAVTNGQTFDLFFLSLGSHTLLVTATDNAGNTATASVTFTIVADIDSLIAMEQRACSLGWIDGDGVCNSLEAKLLAAKASIDRGRFNTAKNQLNAFIAELDAQKDKKVTQGYDILKADAIYVVNNLP